MEYSKEFKNMIKVFIYFRKFNSFIFFIFGVFCLISCTSLSQDKFIDETYPYEAISLTESETIGGKIFYENNKNFNEDKITTDDLIIKIKKGIKYPVSNPLLALSDIKIEKGAMNVFFNFFSGEDGNLMKYKYKAFMKINNIERKINQSILIYKDNRGRQYIKKTFKIKNVTYKFQNSFSDFYTEYPYMFCEITNGEKIYKVFAINENSQNVSDSESGEKKFISQGIKNENQKYVIILDNSIVADFTKSEYKLYNSNSENSTILKESIAIILSTFNFIEKNEN